LTKTSYPDTLITARQCCSRYTNVSRPRTSFVFIFVIPAITNKTEKCLVIILQQYVNVFQRGIEKSLMWINPDERSTFVEHVIQDNYEFRKDGQIFVEYPVRVRNYAEREHFEREHADFCVIDIGYQSTHT
jgi:hypothetical protein